MNKIALPIALTIGAAAAGLTGIYGWNLVAAIRTSDGFNINAVPGMMFGGTLIAAALLAVFVTVAAAFPLPDLPTSGETTGDTAPSTKVNA